jgi:hypothetical protein
MDLVAQLVRASVCGIEGRGFEPHSGPIFFARKAAWRLYSMPLFLFPMVIISDGYYFRWLLFPMGYTHR